ncbi:MAG: transporter substrate-binding domain-containing protein, partial [Oligoflexia bacterium]|nr:transporter substrate-binding domain-containing protein [Oligoflexia bacterium]
MKKFVLIYFYFFVSIFISVSIFSVDLSATASTSKTIQICEDDAGWPPFSYADPKNPSKVIGAAAEVVEEILRINGYDPKITMVPWARCLIQVEEGKSAMLVSATYNEERASKYLISDPYYTVTSALFYDPNFMPKPPKITTVDDMQKYTYCGLQGYNYTMYKLPPDKLDTGAKDEQQRVEKLRGGRC